MVGNSRPSILAALSAVTLVGAVLLSACASPSDTHTSDSSSTRLSSGGQVMVLTPFPQGDSEGFQSTFARFTRTTGVSVNVRGAGGDFITELSLPSLRNRVDVAHFAQVGLIKEEVAAGRLVPLDPEVARNVEQNLLPAFRDQGLIDGIPYAIPIWAWTNEGIVYRKSLIKDFPTTWNGLETLIEDLRARGITPWCIGADADGATGWALTTLIEQYVRGHGGADPAGYTQRWIDHEITVDDPVIRASVEWLAVQLSPGYNHYADATAVRVEDSHEPLFTDPPGCAMAPAYGWMENEYPPNAQDVLGHSDFPVADGTVAVPRGGVEMIAAFNDNPNTVAMLRFIASTPDYGIERARSGGYLSPFKGVTQQDYPWTSRQQARDRLETSTTLIPDASDQMPSAVGSGSYWRGLTELASGSSVDDALRTMESGWAQVDAEKAENDGPG